jgi:enoyl-CoA hydratase/carnithine racemase
MDFSKFQTVKVEIAGDIAWVTRNRPDKRNAMSSSKSCRDCARGMH